jgi:phage shock protein A
MSELQAREDEGSASEALSADVLRLKVDDLFQEVESLKRRIERLEGRTEGSENAPAQGVVSDPDDRVSRR